MALTKVSRGLLSTGIVDNSTTTAITIGSDESTTFSGPITLTAGALAAAGNAGLSHRSADNKVYLQAGTGGFNILDDQQNTHFSIDSAGVSTFNNNVGIGGASGGAILQLNNSSASYLDIKSDNVLRTRIYNDSSQTILESTTSNLIFKSASTERMRLSGGSLLVGKTVADSIGTDGIELDGANDRLMITRNNNEPLVLNRRSSDGAIVIFRKDGAAVGSISTNANSLPSDRNFKKNIENLSLGLNFISSLEPVTYNYKIDDDGAPVMAGLIAQDVETALTAEGVEANSMTLLQHKPTEDVKESDYQMDYLKLVPVLINAVKELTERLEQLENN